METSVTEDFIMDKAAEEAFDSFCKVTGVKDKQIGLVRHGWVAALNWQCSAPSASTNKPMPKFPTLRKVKQVYRSQLCLESRWEHVAIEFVYDYIRRQLSA